MSYSISFQRYLFAVALILSTAFLQLNAQNAVPRIKINPKGHSARINTVLFTPDASKLVTVSEDKSIRIWDPETGEMINKFQSQISDGSGGMFYAADISPDGRLLAVSGFPAAGEETNYIIIIDLNREIQTAVATGHYNVINGLSFSGDGKYLISASDDGTVKFWQVSRSSKFRELSTLEVGFPIQNISVNSKTNQLAIATQSRDIWVYDFTDLKPGDNKLPMKAWKKHKGNINKVKFSADGKYLASTSLENELALWDTSGELLFMKDEFVSPINALDFSHDSRVLAALDFTGRGFSYSLPSGSLYTNEFKGHDNIVFSAVFSPKSLEGNYVVASAGGTRNEIVLWNAISAKVVKKISGKGQFIGDLAFGEGMNLYISPGFKEIKPSYEYKFDFSNMLISPDPAKPDLNSQSLKGLELMPDLLTLEISRGKSIENNEYLDGYIRSYAKLSSGNVLVGSDFSLKLYSPDAALLKEFLGHTGGVWSVAASQDGQYVASGSDDQTIKIWKLDEQGAAPSMVSYFEGEEDIMELLNSLESDSLINTPKKEAWRAALDLIQEYYGNKTVRIFQEQYENLGEIVVPFANLFLADDNEWVCWVPSGYFGCSSQGADYFGWHVNNGIDKLADFYSADQYFELLYRPQLLSRSIKEGKRAKDILLAEGEKIFDLSKLSKPSAGFFNINALTLGANKVLDYDDGKYRTNQQKIPVSVDIFDGGGGIQEVNIYHNGKLVVHDTEVKSLQEEKKKSRTYEIDLLNDLNNFRVVVINYQGIESRPDYLKVEYTGEKLITASLHILSIGINEYEREDYKLNYAKPDANSFTDSFISNARSMFKTVRNRIELYDGDATRENILKAFETIISQAGPEDMFVFYYAGHGTVDELGDNEYYLVPPDVTELYGDSQQLKEKGISATQLKELLSRIKSTKQLILMDACHSGAAIEKIAGSDDKEERQRAITQLARSSGVAMLTSTNSQQFATEFDVLQHGVFTYSLLDALNGAADTGDSQVSVYELKLYMERVVPQLSKQYGGESQRPIAHVFGNDFPIAIVSEAKGEEQKEGEGDQ